MEPKFKPSKKYMEAVGGLYGNTSVCVKEKRKSNGGLPIKDNSKKRRYIEDNLQMELISLARKHPICKDYLFHIANERRCSMQEGVRLKAKGVKRGVSDLFLAYPVGNLAGFFIELKSPGKRPSEHQQEFMTLMQNAGYRVAWFCTVEKAWSAILEYLDIDKNNDSF